MIRRFIYMSNVLIRGLLWLAVAAVCFPVFALLVLSAIAAKSDLVVRDDATLTVWFTPGDTGGMPCKYMADEARRHGVRHWNCL